MALVVDSALRAALVAGVAAAVLHAWRVRNPHARKMLWTAVVGAGLLMPLALRFRILAAPLSSTVLPAISIAAPVASVPETPRHLIEGLYAAVLLVLLARLALGIGRMRRVRRRAVRLEVPSIGHLDVRISASLASPVTFGSTILLPSDCLEWPKAKRAAVLIHERSHVEQRDSYVHWLALLHAAMFWFSPLAWWLLRHLAELAEQTSDEAVLAEGGDRAAYASVLLQFARAGSRLRPATAMTGSGVAQRVERIVSGAPIHTRLPAWKRAVVIGLVLIAAVLAASLWRLGMAQPSATGSAWAQHGSPRTTPAEGKPSRTAQASTSGPKVIAWTGLGRYYPRRAERAGIEGVVRLAVTLDGGGRPTGVAILSEQPPGHGFGAAAANAADAALRYSNPAGRPAGLVIDVRFALHH